MVEVFLSDDLPSFGLAVYIVDTYPSGIRRLLRFGESFIPAWEDITEAQASRGLEPTLRFEDQVARALLESLTRHYNGAEDTRALRRDYDDERKRVDNLTSAVIRIVQGGP